MKPDFGQPLRGLVLSSVVRSVGGPPRLLEEYRHPEGDPGLFGPGSVVWRVHADLPAMLVGGISSLMLQSLHPLVMAGVADHSLYQEDPLGRLQRTARFVAGTTYGAMPLVEELVAGVRRIHARVRGRTADGRAYSAGDPDLLTWVHTAEVWSFLRAHQRYAARPLAPAEKDRYLAEVATVGRLLGAIELPSSVEQVRAYFRRIRPELELTPEAREAVQFLRTGVGRRPAEQLANRVVASAALDLLPGFARTELRLPRPPLVGTVQARAAATAFAALLHWAVGESEVCRVAAERARAY